MTDNPKSTFARRVRAAKPRAKKYDVWDDVISGLGLRVGTSGHCSFFLRRSVRGRIRSATIGNADTMSVRATPTLPTRILWRRRRKSEASLPTRCRPTTQRSVALPLVVIQ